VSSTFNCSHAYYSRAHLLTARIPRGRIIEMLANIAVAKRPSDAEMDNMLNELLNARDRIEELELELADLTMEVFIDHQ
jgi:hypothetical protein